MTIPDLRRVYVRAWSEPPPETEGKKWQPTWTDGRARSDRILVIDVETTVTVPQRMLFGFAALCEVTRDEMGIVRTRLLNGWRFHADDLQTFNPNAFDELASYTAENPGEHCSGGCCWYNRVDVFPLLSQTEFLDEVFWGAVYKARIPVVGFNLPFDLSMLARFARTTPRGDGFSLDYWGEPADQTDKWKRPPYRPGLVIQRMGSGHEFHFTGFRLVDEVDTIPEGSTHGLAHSQYRYRGHFWDLSQIAFALTHKRLNLHDTGEEFSAAILKTTAEDHGEITPEYIAYNRHDVAATVSLFERVMTEYERHPIDLKPESAYSPASIGKAYLDAMGVLPPRTKWPDFPKQLLGKWAATYYAGRSEMRGRHIALPVVYSDAVAMFPTVCTLVGLWQCEIADHLEIVDWTDELQELVERAAEEGPGFLLDPEVWKTLVTFGEIVPNGDIVPVRSDYDDTPDNNKRVGVSGFFHDGPLPYTAADLLASAILTGRAPKILNAVRLVPVGVQHGLRSVKYRGMVDIDPEHSDFYKFLVEDRYRWETKKDTDPDTKWLAGGEKILNNALSYGVKMEFNPQSKSGPSEITGYDGETFTIDLDHPEIPGRFCFPPFAATITGGARLFLAIRERLTTDAGGAHYLCDTDSMAIIATKNGRPIPCPIAPDHPAATQTSDGQPAVQSLTWETDDQIRARFDSLNPYDRDLIPELWKVEKENYDEDGVRRELHAYGISAKRYTFLLVDDRGEPEIAYEDRSSGLIKPSEHGLGALMDPLDPESGQVFSAAVWEHVLAEKYEAGTKRPPWLDRPAIRKAAVSTPHVWKALDQLNEAKPYAEWIKPFSFMMSPQAGRWRAPDPLKFIAPFDRDPRRWSGLKYVEVHSGRVVEGEVLLALANLETVVEQWRQNPENVAEDHSGIPCSRTSEGLLGRRCVAGSPLLVVMIGKEGGSVESQLEAPDMQASTHLTTYPHPVIPWSAIKQVVKQFGLNAVASEAGTITTRGLRNALRHGVNPRDSTKRSVIAATARLCRDITGDDCADDMRSIASYITSLEHHEWVF